MIDSSNIQNFNVINLPCKKVVVYCDRAEVKRLVKTKLKSGVNELIISNLSHFIDKDSIRVEGQGKANVLDVSFQERHVSKDNATNNERAKQINQEIKNLEIKLEKLNMKRERIQKQLNLVNEYANTLSKPLAKTDDKENASIEIETFMNFLETYENRIEKLDNELFTTKKSIEEVSEDLNAARNNLGSIGAGSYQRILEIKILIETNKDDTEVGLLLTYLVSNASWTPKYDIRVLSDTKKMIINYFGLIRQATKEDWNEAKISLSTSNPAIGGTVPELETQSVRLKPKYKVYEKISKRKGSSLVGFLGGAAAMSKQECLMYDQAEYENPVQQLGTTVSEGTISSTFDIPRLATIPCDNNTHKVTIGIINLDPVFEYATVPKKCPMAFLKAKVKNTSQFPILAGDANVFFDNCFVANTHLKSYSTQEEFTCSLGVDPAIKVDYKPLKKYREQNGIINKTVTMFYEQLIEIKNTTSNNIKIMLIEQLPLSSDDKIKVNLLEPIIKSAQNVKINQENNLEFDLKIDAGKAVNIKVKYSIDYPVQEDIQFV